MNVAHPQTAESPVLDQLFAWWAKQDGPLAVLTGAGVSSASGIPTYRDDAGQWQHRQPIQHQAFMQSELVRRRYWARSFLGWPVIAQAQPSAAHRVLAEMASLGLVSRLITQNVDGLHQRAGHDDVLELHGGLARVCCMNCRAAYARADVQNWLCASNPHFDPEPLSRAQRAPDGDVHLEDQHCATFQVPNCPACGGVLKPDVVFFGDNVPKERVAEASDAIHRAAGLLVVGSSLMVYSGYRFVELAHQSGKPVFAINQGSTRADKLWQFKISQDCTTALPVLLQRFQHVQTGAAKTLD